MARYSFTDPIDNQNATRPVAGTTSVYTPSAPTTTAESRQAVANQVLSNTTPAPAVSSSANSNPVMPRTDAGTTPATATQTSRYSVTGAPVTQTSAPTSTPSNQAGSRGWSFATSSPTTTATTPATTPEATPAAETPEAASEETPQSTAYTPTTVRTTTAANNQSTTNTAKSTPATYTPTGMYDPDNLKTYNDQRVADIRSLYEQALQNSLAGMRTAYDQNMSDAQAARDQISPQYQRSMNALSAEYERQRRNNNMQAAANGLNTGTGSQMALAQSANYQANQSGLAARENEALNEANRRIGDLQRNYQNAIAEATANNNYKLAASLLDEYQNAYKRQMDIENTNYQRAQQVEQQNYTRSWNEDEREYSRNVDEANRKAQYGDFSGYATLYGDDAAQLMEQTWALQNPYQAWAAGKISAEDFYAITGKLPANPADVADQLAAYGYTGSGSSASANGSSNNGSRVTTDSGLTFGYYRNGSTPAHRKTGSSYSRGYSASRDRAYRGAPGYLNTDGQFVVPTYGWNTNNTTAARGHEGDKALADDYAREHGVNVFSTDNNLGSNDGNNWTKNNSGNDSTGNVVTNLINNLFG